MTFIRKISALAAATFTAVMMTAGSAQAQARIELGVLDCNLGESVGFIIASEKAVACRFTSADGRFTEVYYGGFDRIGLDFGVSAGGRLQWLVLAPTTQFTPGALEGDYVGLSAEASLGVGLGANALIGGFDRSFALQPLSVQAQEGLNAALGIGILTLVSPA